MSDPVRAAEAYENLHVPALFGQWAPRLLEAVDVAAGDTVLDVACGTGVLAREAVGRVGPKGRVAGVDPDPGMLTVAQRLEPAVEWRQGTADALPWPDAAFDVVVSQFGLMFFPDRSAAVEEMLRVAAPGGRLGVAVWDALDRTAAYPEIVGLLERVAGPDAADALRAPFVLGDTEELAQLLTGAGARDVTVTTRTGTARFPGVRTMVEADLRGWLPVVGVVLEDDVIERILGEAEEVLAPYVTPEAEVVFDTSAHVIVAGRSGDGS